LAKTLHLPAIRGASRFKGELAEFVFDVEAEQIEQLPADDRDLSLVDAVGAEDRTAAAFGALVEIVEPFLQNLYREVPGSGRFS
jgi:hypothetical protein